MERGLIERQTEKGKRERDRRTKKGLREKKRKKESEREKER